MCLFFFFFKHKTAYEMRISDWSSDVCSSDLIRDHYKPVGQGDDVPTAPVTVAVALADKLDTIFQFFRIDEAPTGSKDPFALRRAALGAVAISLQSNLRWSIMLTGASALTGSIFKEWHAGKTQPFIDMLQALTPLINSGNAQELMVAVGAVLTTMPKLSAPNPEVLVETVVAAAKVRSEEHTSELQSLMRISYAVFCLKKKTKQNKK